MRSVVEAGSSVPAFLAKLWKLVNDCDTNHLISWSSEGKAFCIQNQADFARELLPLYYKHNNMASFIRQLNMYGFHKVTSVENGGLRGDKDEIEFSHPCFMEGHAYLLEHIKRKIANPKPTLSNNGDKILVKPELMNKVLSEVKQMKGRQESMDARFSVMKQENEALWREIAILRQKHSKQQQIVNNLIQFLMSLVQPSRGSSGMNSGVKRRYQLMIQNAAHDNENSTSTKNPRLDEDNYDVEHEEEFTEEQQDDVDGPIIHELAHDDILTAETIETAQLPNDYITVEVPPYSPGNSALSPRSGSSTQQTGTIQNTSDAAFIENMLSPSISPIVTSPSPSAPTRAPSLHLPPSSIINSSPSSASLPATLPIPLRSLYVPHTAVITSTSTTTRAPAPLPSLHIPRSRIITPLSTHARAPAPSVHLSSSPIITSPLSSSPSPAISPSLSPTLHPPLTEHLSSSSLGIMVSPLAVTKTYRKSTNNIKKKKTSNDPVLGFNTIHGLDTMPLPADIFADDTISNDSTPISLNDVNHQAAISQENASVADFTQVRENQMMEVPKVNLHKTLTQKGKSGYSNNSQRCKAEENKKKSNKEEIMDGEMINPADIKQEWLEEGHFSDMSVATRDTNTEFGRFGNMTRRDNYSDNRDKTTKGYFNTANSEVDDHLESMQNDLESLRELLRGDNYSLDANTLLGLGGAAPLTDAPLKLQMLLPEYSNSAFDAAALFNQDDPFYGLSLNPMDDRIKDKNADADESNQIMAYTAPPLLQLDDLNLSLVDPEVTNSPAAMSPHTPLSPLLDDAPLNTPQVSLTPTRDPFHNYARY